MAISMKNIVSLKDIPQSWIFKYFSAIHKRQINQPFDGRSIQIKSFWNNDTNPSLFIYYDTVSEKYKWKDHSSGNGGDAIELVKNLYDFGHAEACNLIASEYAQFLERGGEPEEEDVDNFIASKVNIQYETRVLERADLEFWGQWGIDVGILNEYNVIPFKKIRLIKGNSMREFDSTYGFVYLRNSGMLYQVYQPNNQRAKYLSVEMGDYMIGEDQLQFKSDSCGILSGLKDIMAMKGLGLDSEYVAPKSESDILSIDNIKYLKSTFKNVYAILDNDKTGMKYMRLYKDLYNIPFVKTGLSKDIALDRKCYGASELKNTYAQMINSAINK